MAGFSDEDKRRVREANDIVDLFAERSVMRQRGRDFWCCCPFHQEKTPSCKVDPATQTWHCFGCGEGGDIFTYIQKLDDLSFVDAVRFLARRGGVELTENPEFSKNMSKKARLRAVCSETASFYHTLLMRSSDEGPAAARSYLAGRDLGGSVPNAWNLGYAPGRGMLVNHLRSLGYTNQEMIDANVAVMGKHGISDRFYNRVMFPINDARGDCIAFGGRVIGQGEPKYLNSGDTPLFHKSEVLYALDKAKARMTSTGDAIVVEGYTDVIALHESGFTNVVATLGTSLTRQHIRLLAHHAKKRIIYLFDGDEAGQRAADRALQFIDSSITEQAGSSKIDLCAVTLPDNLDPAEFIAERGAEAFSQVLSGAQDLIKFGIDRRFDKPENNLSTPQGRSNALNAAIQVLAPIKDSLVAQNYAGYIADKVLVKPDEVLRRLAEVKYTAPVDYEARTRNQCATQASAAPKPALSSTEKNRLKMEREFLSLCAQNPAQIQHFLNELGQIEWHNSLHRDLALVLMDASVSCEDQTVAGVLAFAQTKNDRAMKVLTSSLTQGYGSAYDTMRFAADDLLIGDMETSLVALRVQIAHAQTDEESAILRESYMVLQKELHALRLRHRPIDD